MVNPFLDLVHTTHHIMEIAHAQSCYPNRKEGDAEGRANDWNEIITR